MLETVSLWNSQEFDIFLRHVYVQLYNEWLCTNISLCDFFGVKYAFTMDVFIEVRLWFNTNGDQFNLRRQYLT